MKFSKVLVLAPHTDDGELGAGGFISRLISEGSDVYYAAFSTAEKSVPEGMPTDILKTEVRSATSALSILNDNLIIFDYEVRKLNYSRQDILEDLVKLRREITPDLVLIPSINDVHQDHHVIAEEATRAFKHVTLLGYELIWNNLTFNSTMFVSLSKRDIHNKYQALLQYKSQSHREYMKKNFIYSLAKVRGVQIGVEYAECFEVIRWVI